MVNAINNVEGYVGRNIAAYRSDEDPSKANADFMANAWAIRIAEEVNLILEEKGENQVWLGKQMDVSRSRVSYILNASPNITLLTLAKLAVGLGVRAEVSLNLDRYLILPKPSFEEDKDLDRLFRNAVTSGAVIAGTANATS